MTNEIKLKPIGIIYTPYKEPKMIPIQSRFSSDITGTIKILPDYLNGLKGLKEFSHLILIYHFHLAKTEKLISRPFLEDKEHGIFAIRSPNRPNHIGISIVKLLKIKKNIITFSEIDILDQTPLLDIKPFISHFDIREGVKNGWLEKHFKNGKIPKRTKLI